MHQLGGGSGPDGSRRRQATFLTLMGFYFKKTTY